MRKLSKGESAITASLYRAMSALLVWSVSKIIGDACYHSCLINITGDANKHRYVIATQSHPLRVRLRFIPGVPIVHVNRSVMVIEPPSDATMKIKERVLVWVVRLRKKKLTNDFLERRTGSPSFSKRYCTRRTIVRRTYPAEEKRAQGSQPLERQEEESVKACSPGTTGET